MNDSIAVLRRRKGLTFALLLFTLIGTIGVGVMLPWTYQASVTETLLNSESSSQALGGGNPYLAFDPSMVDMANVLALKLTDSQNILTLKQQGGTASLQAQVMSENPQNEEPFIQISVSGSSKVAVAQTLQGAAASLSTILAQLQSRVPARDRASLQTITEVSTPVRSTSAKLKPLVGFLGIGLVLTFLIPQAVEGSAARRRKHRTVVTAPVDDQPYSVSLGSGTESDRFHQSQVTETRSEGVERQRSNHQIGDVRGQHMPPTHQGGRNQIPREYGVPSPDDSWYSQNERSWLCGSRNPRQGIEKLGFTLS